MGGNPYRDHVIEAVFKTARGTLTLRQIVAIIFDKYAIEVTREQARGIIKTLRRQANEERSSMKARLLEVDYRRARRSGHYINFIEKLQTETKKLVEQQQAREEYERERAEQDRKELADD